MQWYNIPLKSDHFAKENFVILLCNMETRKKRERHSVAFKTKVAVETAMLFRWICDVETQKRPKT